MKGLPEKTTMLLSVRRGVLCVCVFVFSIIFVLFFFLLPLTTYAAEQDQAQNLAQNQATGELKVTYFPVQQHLGSIDNAGLYVRALFKILTKYISNEISFIPLKSGTNVLLDALNKGEANVGAFFVKTPERMLSLKYSKNPIATANILIVTDPDKGVSFNDRKALNGKSIAIHSRNSIGRSRLDEYLIAKNISMQYKIYKDPVEYANSDANFHLSSSYYFVGNKDIVARIGTQGLYFVALHKNSAILHKLDYALEQAKKLDAKALRELEQKYLEKSSESLNLSAAEKYLLNTRKPYQIGYSGVLYPVQYTSDSGKPRGIAIGVHRLFTQMHPSKDGLVPYVPNTGADITKFDIIFSIIGDHEAKKKHFVESKPYLVTPMFVFEPIELDTVKKPILGMLDYSVLDHSAVQEEFPHWQLKTYNTFLEMFNDYDDGKIQYMLVSEPGAEYAFSELGVKENKLSVTDIFLPLKFYVAKKHVPAALNILNAFIDALSNEDVSAVLLDVENTARAPATPLEFLEKYKVVIASVTILLIALLLLAHFTRLYLVKRKLHKLSLVDKLTGLGTKEKTFATMEHILPTVFPGEYMLISMDVDRFHLLNQVYGKEKADKVLCLFANCITDQFGKGHKAESICRLRDDVFVVFSKIIPEVENCIKSGKAAELELDIKNVLHTSYNISLSFGVYVIDDVTLPVETMLDCANVARRMGKKEHGISIHYFNEKIQKTIENQKEIIYKMEQGVENKEFILNFQPKVCLKTDKICGAEVLVRWYLPDGSVIYPDSFIPIFEANAFISRLDLYVFEKTCEFINAHRSELSLPPLAVNLSGISVMHPETRVQMQDIMSLYNIKPSEIEIEITESAMVNEADDFTDNIQELCNAGLKLSIDDFGTGVSSLYRLSTLCVDAVKLDKAFLDAKFTTKKGVFLVASIISMLRRLGMQVIAEGVETETHIKILKKLHCDVVQGYYYFKPLSEKNFIKVLTSRDFSP